MVSVFATGPKGYRFKPSQGDGFLKAIKNLQHTFLLDGKYRLKVPCRKILQ
jgi:hypothetical protein